MRLRSPIHAVSIIVFLLGVCARTSHGFPIPSTTIWELTESAEVVVLADVERTEPKPPGAPGHDPDIAHLSVRQVFKGSPPKTLAVEYRSGWSCPPPPLYLPGRQVLAFLRKGEQYYHTYASHYGTIYPEAGELDDFRELVQGAAALQANPPISHAARTAWLVRAAARRGTRWHGLDTLMPPAEVYEEIETRKRAAPPPSARFPLTNAQRQALADGFVAAPGPDYLLPAMLKILQGHEDKAFDLLAMGIVEGALKDDKPPVWLPQALFLLRTRLGDPKARSARPKSSLSDERAPVLRQEWEAARKRLRLPVVVGGRLAPE